MISIIDEQMNFDTEYKKKTDIDKQENITSCTKHYLYTVSIFMYTMNRNINFVIVVFSSVYF